MKKVITKAVMIGTIVVVSSIIIWKAIDNDRKKATKEQK